MTATPAETTETERSVDPLISVDAASREQFFDRLHDLNATGLTVGLVDHDVGVVTTGATDVASLDRQLYFDGDLAAVVETDAFARAYEADQHGRHHDH